MDRTLSIVSLVVALGSMVATIGAWLVAARANRHAARANSLAQEANDIARHSQQTSSEAVRIERDRRRAELRPQLEFTLSVDGYGGTTGSLQIALVGPPELEGLIRVEATIEDEYLRPIDPTREEFSVEEMSRYIWGPFRFAPSHIDNVEGIGRNALFPLALRQPRTLELVQAPVPPRVDPARWYGLYHGRPLLLNVHCSRGPGEEWRIPVEVPQPSGYRSTRGS